MSAGTVARLSPCIFCKYPGFQEIILDCQMFVMYSLENGDLQLCKILYKVI